MVLVSLLVLAMIIEGIWSPRLDFIKRENLLIMHYNQKNTRNYLVIVKF
jgi:hypothetical protein